MSEPCRLRRGEGYGACDDEMMDPSRTAPTHTGHKKKRFQNKPPCSWPSKPRPREWEVKEGII